MENRIHYGFGLDYLSDWDTKAALREILQNFLDYGAYQQEIVNLGGLLKVTLTNDWNPESLDFLRIGRSVKRNYDAIGKHGEGLKMAFLILLREGYKSSVLTPKYHIEPSTYIDNEIGECFCLNYTPAPEGQTGFSITFTVDEDIFNAFNSNVIKPEDILFTEPNWGDIVDKPTGNIYSGGLFVAHVKNMGHAYNILPHRLPLDRDRSVPQSFDVNHATSRIRESFGKFTTDDLSHTDTMYISTIPEPLKKQIKPIKVGNSVEFVYKDSAGKSQILSNTSIKQSLQQDSFFTKAINKIKSLITKESGLYDLLTAFQKKHYMYGDQLTDFNIILDKCAKMEKIPKVKQVKKQLDQLPF